MLKKCINIQFESYGKWKALITEICLCVNGKNRPIFSDAFIRQAKMR